MRQSHYLFQIDHILRLSRIYKNKVVLSIHFFKKRCRISFMDMYLILISKFRDIILRYLNSVRIKFKCIDAERKELIEAAASGNIDDITEEMGDLLFSCVNAARHLGVNAELALKASTEKFIKRFSVTEQLTKEEGLDMKELPIEKLDIYWDKAKKIIMEEQSND